MFKKCFVFFLICYFEPSWCRWHDELGFLFDLVRETFWKQSLAGPHHLPTPVTRQARLECSPLIYNTNSCSRRILVILCIINSVGWQFWMRLSTGSYHPTFVHVNRQQPTAYKYSAMPVYAVLGLSPWKFIFILLILYYLFSSLLFLSPLYPPVG